MKAPAITRKVYLFAFIDDLMLIYPFYALLFADRGLDNFDIAVVVALWSITSLVMEVPSGVLADRFDRRYVLAFGGVAKSMGLLVWVLYPTFTGFAVGFALWGLQNAMQSGTFQALVYDELKASGKEQRYVTVSGRASAASFAGVIASAAVGALAIRLGYDFVLWVSVVVSLASIAVALWLPRAAKSAVVEDARYFTLLRAAVREALTSKVLLLPLLCLVIVGAAEEGFIDYVALFGRDVGLTEAGVAVLYAAVAAGGAIGAVVAERMGATSISRPVVLMVVGGVPLAVAARLGDVWGAALLVAYFFVTHSAVIAADGALQHAMTGETRATVTSVSAFTQQILVVAILLGFGAVADEVGRLSAFLLGGMAVVVVGIALLLLIRLTRQRFTGRELPGGSSGDEDEARAET